MTDQMTPRNADQKIWYVTLNGTNVWIRTQKAYLRLPWVWIRTFGPRELGLWVWPESYRTLTLESQFDTYPSTEKLRPQSLKWTGFLVGERPDHVFWQCNLHTCTQSHMVKDGVFLQTDPSRQLTVHWQPTMLKIHKESDFHLPQSQNCLLGYFTFIRSSSWQLFALKWISVLEQNFCIQVTSYFVFTFEQRTILHACKIQFFECNFIGFWPWRTFLIKVVLQGCSKVSR